MSMPSGKDGSTDVVTVLFPFAANAGWFDGPAAAPVRMVGVVVDESLGFASEWMQEQVDYTKHLLGCATATDVLQCHWDFLGRVCARSASQASRLSEALRANVVPAEA